MKPSAVLDLTPEERVEIALREKMKGWAEKDIVAAWFRSTEKFELSAREDYIRQRWTQARALFLAMQTYAEIVEALQQDFGISISQARNDVADMQRMFGDIEKVSKDAHRARAIEMSLSAFKTAKDEKDSAGMAAATKTYILATGIDRDDPAAQDLEKAMQERMYVEVLDPRLRSMLHNYAEKQGGVVDTTKLVEAVISAMDEGYIDIESEEMNDDDTATDPQ